MNIIRHIYDTLAPLGYPVYLQGSLAEDAQYPDNFITYWIPGSESESFYDNAEHRQDWEISIIFYTKDIQQIILVIPQIISALRDSKFTVYGRGNFIPSDELDTVGWTLDCRLSQYNKGDK